MAYTAKDRLDEAAVLLNDANKTLYNFNVLLPFLKIALQELEDTFVANSVKFILKRSAVISVAANAVTLVLPDDFLLPISLEERAVGETDDNFIDMTEQVWIPSELPIDTLRYWTWADGQVINLLGANTPREVRVKYYRVLSAINVPDDAITINHVKQFLSGRSASIAAFVIGENTTRAQSLDGFAQKSLDRALAIAAKKGQARPVRRKPYGTHRRG
jgi:hypothetical protein